MDVVLTSVKDWCEGMPISATRDPGVVATKPALSQINLGQTYMLASGLTWQRSIIAMRS